MYTDSFIIYVKTDDFYKDISNDIDKWFDTSNYSKDIDRTLEKGKNKKVIGKFKDELGGLIMSEVCIPTAKTYAFLLDGFTDNDYSMRGIINNKAEGTQTCVIKNKITFNDYVDVLFSDKNIKISQFTFRSDHHNVYTEKVNKIALSSNDDKRIQANDKITTYPYGHFDNNEIVDIKENNTKNELDILWEEGNALRNNSKILREGANTIRNSSKNLGEEVNDVIKESHAIKENNTKSEVDILRKESKELRNNSKILREEANTIRNKSKLLREEINDIIKEPIEPRNNSIILREEANTIRNNSKILREEVNNIIKESHAIKENNTKSEVFIIWLICNF